MSNYTIAQVEALSGIKAHTLRKWETRYNLFEPYRTDTNIRYYSDGQLKKLLNISVLLRNGFKISKIDKMSDEDIYETIGHILIDPKQEDEIASLIISMIEMDEIKFDKIIKSQIINNGLLTTTTKIIYPFLNQVGVLWGINKVIPAQEHFVSSLIKQKMYSSIDLLPQPHNDAPSILMFLPEREHHEMGLLLAYFIAKKIGWRVYYLGQDVPTENIKLVVEEIHVNALLSMFVVSTKENFDSIVGELCSQIDVPFLISGNPELLGNVHYDDLIYLKSPEELINQLNLLEEKIKPLV